MYYPKQIPYILDEEFKRYIDYREHHIKELEDFCMCIWEMKSKSLYDKTIYNNVLPDACIDIVIDFKNKNISFAGFSDETMALELNSSIDFMGVRFKPGAFYALYNINADEIMDKGSLFSNIEKDELLLTILDEKSLEKRLEIFKKYLIKKVKDTYDTKFISIANELYESPKDQKVEDIALKLNCGEKQLFRLFKKNYGVSPKVLLNILRLHLCLTLLLEDNMELIDIAHECGFYDQSHFIKEIKRYTGISPLQLLKSYEL